MRRLRFAAAATALMLSGVGLPVVALSQSFGGDSAGVSARLDDLRARIRAGVEAGQLSEDQADRLIGAVTRIREAAERERDQTGGLSPAARDDLNARIDEVSRRIHDERAAAEPPPPPPSVAAPAPAPAPAPVAPPAPPGWTLEDRVAWLSGRIDRDAREGILSGNEIQRGREELGAIRSEAASLLARDGGQLSAEDRSYLLHRVDELNRTLRWSGTNPPPPWSSP